MNTLPLPYGIDRNSVLQINDDDDIHNDHIDNDNANIEVSVPSPLSKASGNGSHPYWIIEFILVSNAAAVEMLIILVH